VYFLSHRRTLQWLWFRSVSPTRSPSLNVSILIHTRFNDIESAEKCIEGLRKYRNLHPSFSKVCAYAVKTLLAHIHPLLLANTSYPGNYICTAKYRTAHRARSCLLQDQNGETKGRALDKSIYRRVRLNGLRLVCGQPHANPISLPLSIDDEVILLPSPLSVHSTHSHLELGYAGRPVQDQKQPIFQDQTERSPPHNRICPVRSLAHTSPFSLTDVSSLETRIAAQDTIERLHGQMVRGWNDPGCRISVRFADSAEQRELRVRWIQSPFSHSQS